MIEGSQVLYRRHEGVESAPLEGEAILFDPGSNRFIRLNRTASFIWGRIERPVSAGEIASDLAGSFSGVSREDAARDVQSALDEMVSLSVAEAVPPGAEGTHHEGEDR